MQEVPYPYAPQFFSAVGVGLMVTSVGFALFNPSSTDWDTLFLFSSLSIFVSLAFQVANMEALHLNHNN